MTQLNRCRIMVVPLPKSILAQRNAPDQRVRSALSLRLRINLFRLRPTSTSRTQTLRRPLPSMRSTSSKLWPSFSPSPLCLLCLSFLVFPPSLEAIKTRVGSFRPSEQVALAFNIYQQRTREPLLKLLRLSLFSRDFPVRWKVKRLSRTFLLDSPPMPLLRNFASLAMS